MNVVSMQYGLLLAMILFALNFAMRPYVWGGYC